MFAMPYMVAVKSASRRAPDDAMRAQFGEMFSKMPSGTKGFQDLETLFRLGGLKLPRFPH